MSYLFVLICCMYVCLAQLVGTAVSRIWKPGNEWRNLGRKWQHSALLIRHRRLIFIIFDMVRSLAFLVISVISNSSLRTPGSCSLRKRGSWYCGESSLVAPCIGGRGRLWKPGNHRRNPARKSQHSNEKYNA